MTGKSHFKRIDRTSSRTDRRKATLTQRGSVQARCPADIAGRRAWQFTETQPIQSAAEAARRRNEK